MFPTATTQAQSNVINQIDDEEVWVWDDFEDTTIGEFPADWHLPTSSETNLPIVEVVNLEGLGNVLKLEQLSALDTGYNIYRQFSGAPKAVISYKVRAEQTNAVLYLPGPLSHTPQPQTSFARFALNGGNFTVWKDNKWDPILPFESGEWYEVKIEIDAEAGFFNLYIDGEPFLLDEPVTGGATGNISAINTGFFRQSTGIAYFDDIKVTPFIETEAEYILAETFDDGIIGERPGGWHIPQRSDVIPPTATVEALDTDAKNKVLMLEQLVQTDESFNISRSLPASPIVTLTYKVRAEQTDAVVYLPSLRSDNPQPDTSIVRFALYGGHFTYWDDNRWTNITPYEADQWYSIKVTLNTLTGKFDLYIDDQMVLVQEMKTNAGEGDVMSLSLGLYREAIGSVYFDDIYIHPYKAALGASFEQPSYSIAQNSQMALKLVFEPIDATFQAAEWVSSHPDVVSIDHKGVMTGLQEGIAMITAYPIEDIDSVHVQVTVYSQPITSIVIAPANSVMLEGSTQFLTAIIEPENSTDGDIVWSTSDAKIADVDRYGQVTAKSSGKATIYASSPDGSISGMHEVDVIEREVKHVLYVATNGDDDNSGSEQAPFLTIERARTEVRNLNHSMDGDVLVIIKDGTYTLDNTLHFNEADSGFNGHFVIYRAENPGNVIISGGQQLGEWELHDADLNIYKSFVGTDLQTRQLYIDGIRATRARSNESLLRPVKTETGYVTDDAFLAQYQRPEDLEFVYEEIWTNPRVGVDSIVEVDGKAVVTMKQPGWQAASNKGGTSVTYPIYYENAYELLTDPGEWYYNRSDGYAYYIPRIWEDMTNVTAVVPVLEQLAIIKGSAVDAKVENVQFEGLRFQYATWLRPSTNVGHSDAQNNHLRYPGQPDTLTDAAIEIELANNLLFKRNEFSKLGLTALKMTNGVQNTLIEGNKFYDISGGAINVGLPYSSAREVYNPDDHRLVMKNNDILNNIIHDIGVEFKSAAAISAGFPEDMDISHNEIFNIPYSGTHIGYGWGANFQPVTKNINITNNLMYDLLGKGLRDGGAIYSLGNTDGSEHVNLVSENYIRNQQNDSGVLYPDEGSAHWKYTRNVIDLKDSLDWHSQKRWAHVWTNSIHDLIFENNYTTTPTMVNSGINTIFRDTHVYPDADWPIEALEIIERAGLSLAYQDLGTGLIRRVFVNDMILDIGESVKLELTAEDGKGQEQSLETTRIFYLSNNPEIATIDEQGVVTAVNQGNASIDITLINDSMVRTLTANVYIGDMLSEIVISDHPGNAIYAKVGSSVEIEPYGKSSSGHHITLEEFIVYSSDEDVVEVLSDGSIVAKARGTAALVIEGSFKGVQRVGVFLINVWDDAITDVLPLKNELERIEDWYVQATGGRTKDNLGLTLSTPGGHAVYQGRQYLNETLEFGMTINGVDGWPSIMIRNQYSDQGINGTTYIVVIKPDVIELQRFNQGVRTVIYGNIDNFESLAGDAIPNTMLPYNTEKVIRLTALTEDNGVRIIFNVDGEEVFNVLDAGEEALFDPGYFGVIARSGSITLNRTDNLSPQLMGLKLIGQSEILVGESGGIRIYGIYEDGTWILPVDGLTYESSDESIVLIDQQGIIHGISAGKAMISVSFDDLDATFEVEVIKSKEHSQHPTPVIPSDPYNHGEASNERYVVVRDYEMIEFEEIGLRLHPEEIHKEIGGSEIGISITDEIAQHEIDERFTIIGGQFNLSIAVQNLHGNEWHAKAALSHPIFAEIDMTGIELEMLNPRKIGLYRLDDVTGALTYIPSTYDTNELKLKTALMQPGHYVILHADVTFSDIEQHWARDAIEVIAGKGMIKGTGENQFDPERSVTRAEFAALVNRLFQVEFEEVESVEFSDVPADAWYVSDVITGVKAGLIQGTSMNKFSPNNPISRQEIAVIISRALGILAINTEQSSEQHLLSRFVDHEQVADWAKDEISLLIELDVLKGRSKNNIDPRALSTRAEAAVIIQRVFELWMQHDIKARIN